MEAWLGPLVLGVMLAEAAVLLVLHRSKRGLPPSAIAAALLPGAGLAAALWVVQAGGWWGWAGLALLLSLVAHLWDLRRRWPAPGDGK